MNFIIIIKSTLKSHLYTDEKKYTKLSQYFKSNLTNIKNNWKGIKSIVSMKSSSSNTPILLTFQNETIYNPKRIANIFNNYPSTIGKKNQAKIKY